MAVFASPNFAVPGLEIAVRLAVEAGLEAAAIIDGNGKSLAIAGALDSDEARAVAAHATRQGRSSDLLDGMLRGEMLTTSLGEREVRIGIAANCVFFVVVLRRDRDAMSIVADLRSDIEDMVRDARSGVSTSPPPPPSNTGGSSSGPAELPVVEVGVTVPRRSQN
ncbi:MAG TPA: hypothetical protein VGM39_11225 [Kofleriaceae bacterium]